MSKFKTIGQRTFASLSRSGVVSQPSPSPEISAVPAPPSRYEELSCFAKVHQVQGIWRAPRNLNYTREDFDRIYPPDYKGMRIGLPDSGSFAARNLDARFDEISPLMWTALILSPLIIWGGIEAKHLIFPSEKTGHH
ncbi:hypothetical protein BdWA1_001927 [Babesia duncani]|uniref:Uncharacterized protein n=1 Tax=Babesia duncani TaxID=323732 RepID=A0AAD9PLQ8_9APIC|nr:hypothetical protein BdWA1_001927 [Babesia duncani]